MDLERYSLWNRTLGKQINDADEKSRERLRWSFDSFRGRVTHLVSSISAELPGLTIHDITHIDALWQTADTIAGTNYPINPAEAYVLGGAFLLHDSGHVVGAYKGGKQEIFQTTQWRDLVAQRYDGTPPSTGTAREKEALFYILRSLHAEQAHKLPHISWKAPTGESMRLIEDEELYQYYGDLIGEIASSHHWNAARVSDTFSDRVITAPAFLSNANWTVDSLKIALLLRTADAAHIDALRAPWFLFSLKQPQGVSGDHWRFQSKLGQPTLNSMDEIVYSSGSPFDLDERKAWWLAYDTARMIDKEIKDANAILRDTGRQKFYAQAVQGSGSPEAFSRSVRPRNWEPVNVSPNISNIPKIIATLGGEALYGHDPTVAVRELIQNSIDAIHASRRLGLLDDDMGEILVSVTEESEENWSIHVLDNGVGMSRYVLTNVLLDFGNSLWSSDRLMDELPGLSATGYQATGKYGIGFYSSFMLGDNVSVVTRRFERGAEDTADQWRLAFEDSINGRPVLSQPTGIDRLKSPGTRVSIISTKQTLSELLDQPNYRWAKNTQFPEGGKEKLFSLIGKIAPTSDVDIYISFNGSPKEIAVKARDWLDINDQSLLSRLKNSNHINTILIPLLQDGVTIARLALNDRHTLSTLTYNGINCGKISSLLGVALAKTNNSDAKRTNTLPDGSIEAWRSWTLESIGKINNPSRHQLRQVHPLIPNEDLAVWELSEKSLTLQQLTEHIASRDEVIVHDGDISHEDYDEMGSDYFDEFEYSTMIICCPDDRTWERETSILQSSRGAQPPQYPWFLEVEAIDYREILRTAIREAWGDFEVSEDNIPVGTVRGAEILRDVEVFSKKTSASGDVSLIKM